MLVVEESQLLEDTIKDRNVLKLYETLRKHESSSSCTKLLSNLVDERFKQVCWTLLKLGSETEDKKISLDLITTLDLDKDDATALVLVVAATLTQLFVIDNFTGPKSKALTNLIDECEVYQRMVTRFDVQTLSLEGCEAYHLTANPWLLKATHNCWLLLKSLGVHRRLLELEFLVWKHRYITIYLLTLLETPEVLLTDLRKTQEFIFDHYLINDLKENKTQLVRFNNVELCFELIESALLRDSITTSRKILDYASELSSVAIEHTGVLGKRTRFQQNDIPQLVVKVAVNKSQPYVGQGFEPELGELPNVIELDDDTLLPDISFVSSEGEPIDLNQKLNVEAQLLMLAKLDYILRTEVIEESLKDEWVLAYLRSIINSSTVWAIRYKSLAHRSISEKKQMRKMDRALLQLEELIKEVEKEADEDCDTMRMKSFYSVIPLSKWRMQRALGDISSDLCLYKNALEIYTKIEYWEGMIKCYSALGEATKAEAVIRQELAKQETPYLYCLLGDVTEDIQYYEKSWSLSKCRFARAKKSIGTYYYTRRDYPSAIDNYELALKASPSNVSILSLLAYSCLLTGRYDRAAECYRNITYQDDTNFLAWNNLSKAYIKLNQKERAWRTLREAIKCNYEEPKIWENFMLVSIEIGSLDDVITAWHRLIDIRGSHRDDQILNALTYSLIKRSYQETNRGLYKIMDAAIKLVARISTTTSSSPHVWMCYFRLLLRQYELQKYDSSLSAKDEIKVMDLNVCIGKIKNCLQRATPLTTEVNWYQSPEKVNQVLDAYDELADCYDAAFSTFGQRKELWSQWKYFKMSVANTFKTLRCKGYTLS